MGYIKNYVIAKIQHHDRAAFITENALRNSLWYSSTKECYAQRNSTYDLSWLQSPKSDDFVLLAIKTVFQLDLVKIYSCQSECHKGIDTLDEVNTGTSLLFVCKKDSTSAFTAYVEGLRNSLAHGTFNKCQDRTFFISQQHSKPEAEARFFLQSKVDCSAAIMMLAGIFNRIVSSDTLIAKYDCIREEFGLTQKNVHLYSAKYNCYVIIDDDFKFISNRHVEELEQFIQMQTFDAKAVILVNENLGNISLKHRTSPDEKIVVIQQSKLIEYFGFSL